MMFFDVLIDTFLDCLKMLPFLLAAYFVIEFLERKKSEKIEQILAEGGKYGFIPGACLGLIPQCGFSGMAADLYSGNVITPGTLAAVFIATSDEAVPLLIAVPEKWKSLVLLLVLKLITAIIVGCLTDMVIRKAFPGFLSGGYNGNGAEVDCHDHDEEEGLIKATFRHTGIIISSIFIILLIINLLVEWIGDEKISAFIQGAGPLKIFISALIGMIPNCASSVLLTQMYAADALPFSSLFAGLCAGSGIGTLILLKTENNKKRAFEMLLYIYAVSVCIGLLLMAAGM